MKVLSLTIANIGNRLAPVVLSTEYNLGDFSFLIRQNVKEIISFAAVQVLSRGPSGADRYSVRYKEYNCHVLTLPHNLGVVAVTDEDYPQRLAFRLLQEAGTAFSEKYPHQKWNTAQVNDKFQVDAISKLVLKYQKPEELDKITRIQKEIDETKDVLLLSLDQIMKRGESLEELAQKTSELSAQSKIFVNKTKDMNSCCNIL